MLSCTGEALLLVLEDSWAAGASTAPAAGSAARGAVGLTCELLTAEAPEAAESLLATGAASGAPFDETASSSWAM